jgi:cyanophycinase-like exopeptidase
MSKEILLVNGGGSLTKNKPAFDQALELSGSEHPNVVVIPSAKSTELSFDKCIDAHKRFFGEVMGDVRYQMLHDLVRFEDGQIVPGTGLVGREQMQEIIAGADVLHITGGNYPHLQRVWRQFHIEELIKGAAESGKVISGTSAGAIALFSEGLSDPNAKKTGPQKDLVVLNGTGLIEGMVCPHYHDSGEHMPVQRRDRFMQLADQGEGKAMYGVDSLASLIVVEGTMRALASQEGNGAYILTLDEDGKIVETEIESIR